MPRPPTGRRPDSLFDNRYRYDHIYPRGRSGETLRAYDTIHADHPVVIKRPALQDAPPIRGGQEVSILKEKRALEALHGHPVLAELRGSGTFRVGGQSHQYIVMDMARGDTLEALTLRGDQLPPLELYNILDSFLDILSTAHDRGIIYNDVDAKHLFWDRDGYQLKLIDWGNAVFLDSEHPAGINRGSDIQQVGGLLYFLYSGGRRPETGVSDPAGDLNAPDKLKSMINRALSAESGQKYADIAQVRRDLAEIRVPLARERDMLVERVRNRLPNAQSQSVLRELFSTIQDAVKRDPGYPQATGLLQQIEAKLGGLQMQADLDAVRIYLDTGSYVRAADLIQELTARFAVETPLTSYLLALCELMQGWIGASPAGVKPMLDLLFNEEYVAAARALLTAPESRPEAELLTMRLAEAMIRLLPNVVLLHPPLILAAESAAMKVAATDAQDALSEAQARLNDQSDGLRSILANYALAGHSLDRTVEALEKQVMRTHEDRAVIAWIETGRAALNRLVELLELVSDHALSDPTRAGNALWNAIGIDPTQSAFEALSTSLNSLHAALEDLRKPKSWSDAAVTEFILYAEHALAPYAADVRDRRLNELNASLRRGAASYGQLADMLALGGRKPAAAAARDAGREFQTLNESMAAWFEELARKIEEAPHPEYLSANSGLGRILSDGWDAWDRGRGGEAAASGERALALAATEGEKLAAARLRQLSDVLSAWLANDGSANHQRSVDAHTAVAALYLPDEDTARRKFSEQMPNTALYLRAMNKGLVEPMQDASAAAVRVLFLDCVLRGVLALHEDRPEDADFWRDCALKCLPNARTHPAAAALENAIARRGLVLIAVAALNQLEADHSVGTFDAARSAVRAPLASPYLKDAEDSLRALEETLRKWQDGDFRNARGQLDSAMDRASMAEQSLNHDLSTYRRWLAYLIDTVDILINARRVIEEAALVPDAEPDPQVADAHDKMVIYTRRDLGDYYAAQLRAWRDTYLDVEAAYIDTALSLTDKQRLFEGHLNAVLTDRAPALPLMRYWGNLIGQQVTSQAEAQAAAEAASIAASGGSATETDNDRNSSTDHADNGDDPDAPAFVPTGRSNRPNRREMRKSAVDVVPADAAYMPTGIAAPIDLPDQENAVLSERPRATTGSRLMLAVGMLVTLVVVGTIAFLLWRNRAGGADNPVLVNAGTAGTPAEIVAATRVQPTDTLDPTNTPLPTETYTPTYTATTTHTRTYTATPFPTIPLIVPSPTPILPTETPFTPTVVPTATSGSVLSSGATPLGPRPTNPSVVLPTLPPAAQTGTYDLIAGLDELPTDKITWDTVWFSKAGDTYQIGTSARTPDSAPLIVLDQALLTTLLGTQAGQYVKRVEATLLLSNYDEALLNGGQVYFGLGLLSTRSQGPRVDVRARLNAVGVLGVGITQTGQYREKTQIPISTQRVTLAAERNPDSTISVYIDGQLIGASVRSGSWAEGQPIDIYLYVSTGGVLVNLETLKVTLQTSPAAP